EAGGPEAAARAARYEALEKVAADTGAAAVLLGHTLDDQAETVLLGLARGAGARSLAGMPPARGVFRRPLLEIRRRDTAAACAARPRRAGPGAGPPGGPPTFRPAASPASVSAWTRCRPWRPRSGRASPRHWPGPPPTCEQTPRPWTTSQRNGPMAPRSSPPAH